jgi:GWxTD domain-containing protein
MHVQRTRSSPSAFRQFLASHLVGMGASVLALVLWPSELLLVAASTTPSRNERLAALPPEERAWLTEFVAPIILPAEEKLFLELTESYQREIFKKTFWERRERDGLPRPFGPGFQQRYEELRPRLDTEYDGWRSDAGRMVLHYGEPDDVHRVSNCESVFRNVEIWMYEFVQGVGHQRVRHLFYRPEPGPRKLWISRTTPSRSDRIFADDSCRKSFQDLACECDDLCPNDPCLGQGCLEACDVYRVYQEIIARQGGASFGFVDSSSLLVLPEISTEGVDRLRSRFPELADPRARPLHVVGPSSDEAGARTPTRAFTPTPAPKELLSSEEIKDRIATVEPKYRKFLDLAYPLLTQAELSHFLQLAPAEKDRFVREFWTSRK